MGTNGRFALTKAMISDSDVRPGTQALALMIVVGPRAQSADLVRPSKNGLGEGTSEMGGLGIRGEPGLDTEGRAAVTLAG